ncbi:hypothetical protein BraRD5C2_26010 [Bradyrhizobium sp. RD5-C2]|nr:hypothetical protein BraRD5C2_26010 [Bradyrhizobium sp. RD5-C2]
MKSVVLVAFSGSWFCSSLTSKLRKSVELIPIDALVDELDDELEAAEAAAEVAEETVMTRLSSSRARRRNAVKHWDREVVRR